ncbi:MAG: HAD family hydrolase [Acidimicrobiia bacterium]|nr:HAD family hydrolase [Acidimicrobiia bacterium]
MTLDVGGVLTLPPVDELLRSHGLPAMAEAMLVAHHAAVTVEDGLLAQRGDEAVDGFGAERHAYYRAFAAAMGAPHDALVRVVDALAEMAIREMPWTLAAPGALQVIADLNSAEVPVAIVSNSNGTVEAQLRDMGICQRGPGPLPHVAAVIDSAIVGVRKPHPQIFDPALDALGVDRHSVVHVGDTVAFDVAAALAAGITPIHYDASGTCTGDHAHITRLAKLVTLVDARS